MNKSFKYLILSLLLLTCGFISAVGQNDNDFRIYTKAGVKFDIIKNLSNTTEFELRTKDNTSKVANYRLTTQFGYKFNKYFSLGAGYSIIGKPSSAEVQFYGLEYKYSAATQICLLLPGSTPCRHIL